MELEVEDLVDGPDAGQGVAGRDQDLGLGEGGRSEEGEAGEQPAEDLDHGGSVASSWNGERVP